MINPADSNIMCHDFIFLDIELISSILPVKSIAKDFLGDKNENCRST